MVGVLGIEPSLHAPEACVLPVYDTPPSFGNYGGQARCFIQFDKLYYTYITSMKQGVDYVGVCVVYFCHDGKGNVLMAKRSENARDERGRWDIGGGAVDFGESVENTLRKEIKEEYCVDVIDFEFLGFRDVHRLHDGKPTHWISLDYKVLVDPTNAKIGEPHKFDEIGLFSSNKLPENLHSQLPAFLDKYKNRL